MAVDKGVGAFVIFGVGIGAWTELSCKLGKNVYDFVKISNPALTKIIYLEILNKSFVGLTRWVPMSIIFSNAVSSSN